ncbi:MAG TPA: hypothetical protein VFY71_03235 [Planctomycetota bacterium]|nr:hypothetical protein [Planctomycetota bacterium]
MRTRWLLATLLLVPAAALRAQEAAPAHTLLDVLPAGTLAFLGTDDARGLAAAWSDSATGRMYATPEFAEYGKAYRASIDDVLAVALPGLDLKVETLEEWVDGPCALAVLDLAAPPPGASEPGLSLALVLGVSGHEPEAQDLLDKIAEAAPKQGLLATRATDGDTDIITLRAEPDADEGEDDAASSSSATRLAVHAGTLLITHELGPARADWMARLMDDLDGKGGDTLASRSDLKATPAGPGGADIRGWIDAARIYQLFTALAPAMAGGEARAAARLQEALSVLDRLGLDELRSASLRATWAHDVSHSVVRVDWPAGSPVRDALGRFVTGGSQGSLLALVPERPLFACGLVASWEDAFDDIVRCVMVGGQMDAATVSAGLAEMHDALGFDLKDDLLARLDGRVAFAMADVPQGEGLALPGMGPLFEKRNMLLALGVSDADGLRELIDAQLRKAGLHATRQCTDMLGFQVCHVPVFPGVALDYAILPDVLLLSASPTLVQDALRRSATPDLPDLVARKDVASGLAALHAQPGFVGYADGIEWMVASIKQHRSGETDPDAMALFGDGLFGTFMQAQQHAADAFPDVDRAFFERFFQAPAVSAGWVEEQGFSLEMRSP